jgi:hypothetical protein
MLCFLQLAVGSILNNQQVEACYSGLYIYNSSRLHITLSMLDGSLRQTGRGQKNKLKSEKGCFTLDLSTQNLNDFTAAAL